MYKLKNATESYNIAKKYHNDYLNHMFFACCDKINEAAKNGFF